MSGCVAETGSYTEFPTWEAVTVVDPAPWSRRTLLETIATPVFATE
jgi:hypothetical protein